MRNNLKILVVAPTFDAERTQKELGPEWRVIKPYAQIGSMSIDLILLSGLADLHETKNNRERWRGWVRETLECRLSGPDAKLCVV